MPSFPRTILAAVALLVVAWSAVLVRDERLARQAEDSILGNPKMSDARWAEAMEQLEDAELLNPGTPWKLARAQALLLRRDRQAALRVADSVVESEPDNLAAWAVVLRATRGRDARRSAEARAEIRRLNPPVEG